MQPLAGSRHGKQEEDQPNRHFAKVVGVAANSEQACGHKRPQNFLARRDPTFLVLLEAPHLFVGNGLQDEQRQEQRCADAIEPVERRLAPQPDLVHRCRGQPHQQHLPRRNKSDVQQLESNGPGPFPNDCPPVVFSAFLVPAFTSEVERQAASPEDDQQRHHIQACIFKVRAGGHGQAVNGRAKRPETIHPGAFAGDDRKQPRHGRDDDAKGLARYRTACRSRGGL